LIAEHFGPPTGRSPLTLSIQQRVAEPEEIAAPVCFLLVG
jgi:hypothetical protein